ncbi:GEVED domain-containing protein [Hymenobacter edaphi]|nr:GEVED domain-containing protein [Hymenobacter edaphi]
MLLWLASASAWAQTVTIGSATVPVVSPATSSYLYGPIYRSGNDAGSTFNYSRYAHLYTAAELGIPTGAVVTELAWLKSDAGTVTGNNTYTVWLENSTSTTLGTTQTWSAISATPTQVYTSTTQQVTGVAGDYFAVTLSQPFTYNGGNLLVLTDWVKQGTASAAVNFVTNAATGFGLGAANSAALTGTTALTTTYGNRRPTLRVTYTPGGPCTAPPTAGTVQASSASVCAGTPVNFSLQGASYGTGMTYQWQSSTNGTTYTNITGATSTSYSVSTLAASTYFRAVLTCSGQSATTPGVQVTVNTPTYATLPVAESFENAWTSACATRDVPTNTWRNTPISGDNSWRRSDDGTAANWSSTSGAYTPAASAGTTSARFHTYNSASGTVGTLDLYVNLSAAGTKVLSFDHINTTGSDTLTVHLSTDGGATFGPALLRRTTSATWSPLNVSTTATSATAVIRFRVRSDFGTTDVGIDNVALDVLSGVPNCATNFLPANNATGVLRSTTITWSGNGGVPTGYDVYFGTTATPPLVSSNQSGTSYTPTATLAANTLYYYQIVPRNSIGPATGCVVNQFTTGSLQTYCNSNLGAYCGAGNANISGVAISNTTLNNPNTTCNTANGSGYTLWPAAGTTTGTLNPGGTYSVSVTTAEAGIISVWFDWNQNGTHEASEWTQVTTASTANTASSVNITVPGTAVSGQTVMRVRTRLTGNTNGAGDACANFGSGETEDYVVTIAPAAACTAPPTAGTTTASATSICSPRVITLGLQGASFGSGLTYQWQSSTNGTTYTNIAGATSSTYTTAGAVATTTYFRAVLTCSGQSANSTPVTVTVTAPTYAALPVAEGFDNAWVDVCATRDAPSNSWRTTAAATDPDASWRRDDDGASASWTSPTYGIYSPTFTNGTNSARFHSGYASAGTIGLMDLYVNMSAAGTKVLSFDYINLSGADSLTVHLSTDGGATFGPALLRRNTTSAWAAQSISTTATSATAVFRFRARGDFGSTDIGVDNLNLRVLPVCSGTPTAGTTTANVTSICSPTAITLGLQGTSFASGLTFQWQSSTNGTTYTNIAGATNQTYVTAPVTATTYFRAVVTCSGQSANSTPVTVTLNAPTYATLPALENFDNTWIDACATRDVPSNNWRMTPSSTDPDASWRRDDDGAAAGWTSPTGGAYAPLFSQGTNSARFHSYYATAGTVGTLDYYVNMSQAGNKRLTFDFINPTGADSLTVHLSTDGGATFGPALLRLNVATAWTNQALPITTTSATAVIRFRGRGDFGLNDIGLDNVRVESATGCLSPAGLTVGTTTSTTAVLNWVNSGSGTYTVEYGPIGFTLGSGTQVTGITGTTTTLTGLTPGTPYQFYVIQNCGTTTSAAGGPVVFNTQITNDDPTGAITLTVGTACTPVSGTNVGATTTTANGYVNPGTGANACGTGTAPKDVWYRFTTAASGPTSTAVRITVTGVPASQLRAFSATSAAGPFTQIGCSANSSTSVAPNLDLTNLTPSTTYYVRVSGYGSTDTQGPFTICAALLPNCQDPVVPTVQSVTSTTASLNWGGVQTSGSTYEIQYGLQGFALGSGTTITGIAGQTATLSTLTASSNYCFYVRQNCGSVNGFSAWVGPTCFTTDAASATNDEPCNAITANVNSTGGLTLVGTTLGATTTVLPGINLPAACSPANAPKDVWFRVTLPAGVTSIQGSFLETTAGMVRLYTAATCSTGFVAVACQASTGNNQAVGRVNFTGLTAGATYYMAVSGYGSNDTRGQFSSIVLAQKGQFAGGNVNIFPNPVAGGAELNIQISGAKSGALHCEVLNALGQVVQTRTAEVRNGNLQQTLTTTGLAKGLYQVRLRIGNDVMVQKVMVD